MAIIKSRYLLIWIILSLLSCKAVDVNSEYVASANVADYKSPEVIDDSIKIQNVNSAILNDNSKELINDTCKKTIDTLIYFTADTSKDISTNTNKTDNMISIGFKELFLGLYVPFGIFLVGLFYNWRHEKKKKRNETEDFRNLIFKWVDSSKESLKKQQKTLENLAKDVKKSNDINPERYEYMAMIFYKLSNIPIEKYIQVFAIDSKEAKGNIDETRPLDKLIYDLLSSAEYLIRIEDAVKDQYEEYKKAYIEQMNQLNNLYFQIRTITVNANTQISGLDPLEKGLLDICILSISKFMEKNQQSAGIDAKLIIYNSMVTPIENYLLKEISIDKRTDYINGVGNIITNYKAIERQWDANISGYGDNFESYAASYKESFDNVMSSIKYLEDKTETKKWWKI